MKEETKYFESMQEIGDLLNLKYISVLAKILNAKSCNVGIGDDYVKLTLVIVIMESAPRGATAPHPVYGLPMNSKDQAPCAPVRLVLRAPFPLHALPSASDPLAPLQAGSFVAILQGAPSGVRESGVRSGPGSCWLSSSPTSQYDP